MAIPAALDEVVLQCLEKDPADRPKDAAELSRRLSEAIDAARWTPERAAAWWTTHLPEGVVVPSAAAAPTLIRPDRLSPTRRGPRV